MSAPDPKQFDAAKDVITQVITLCAGILALSLTFADKWASTASESDRKWLFLAWLAFFLAIASGIFSMLVLAGLVHDKKYGIESWTLRIPWILEITGFVSGIGLLGYFGSLVLFGS